jgi:signal transduction histidine kinase
LAGLPTTVIGGRSYLSRRVFVAGREPASKAGSLVILYPEDRWSAIMRQAAYPALTTGAIASLAIILVTSLLAHRFVRPIRRLGDRAAAIARGDFAAQPEPVWRHDDEIRDLAVSIHQMAEQLGRYEIQVRRHEQLRTLDRLGAGMAHQLRNAATGGRMAIELHQRECSAGPASESLDVALRQLQLMESYLQRFMNLGREQTLTMSELNLAVVVEDALALVRPACIHAGIELELHRPKDSVRVCGDAEALRQLMVNLVVNAVEEAGRQKETRPRIVVDVEGSPHPSPLPKGEGTGNTPNLFSKGDGTGNVQNLFSEGGGMARVRVSDTGPGPSSDVADRLFEPFVSGKPEGTGLGLYVARQLAEAHHGTIRWERRDGMTCFIVDIPQQIGT